MWVWDSTSGYIDREESYRARTRDHFSPSSSRPCNVIGIFDADENICNGVIPHPFLPKLASYGIDSEIKIWMEDKREDSDGEDGDSREKDCGDVGARVRSSVQARAEDWNHSMETLLDSLLETHLLQAIVTRRSAPHTFANHADYINASRVFQRCDVTNHDTNFIGPRNWDPIFEHCEYTDLMSHIFSTLR